MLLYNHNARVSVSAYPRYRGRQAMCEWRLSCADRAGSEDDRGGLLGLRPTVTPQLRDGAYSFSPAGRIRFSQQCHPEANSWEREYRAPHNINHSGP